MGDALPAGLATGNSLGWAAGAGLSLDQEFPEDEAGASLVGLGEWLSIEGDNFVPLSGDIGMSIRLDQSFRR